MASMATMDYYSIYGALLQTPVEGPGFADDVQGLWRTVRIMSDYANYKPM